MNENQQTDYKQGTYPPGTFSTQQQQQPNSNYSQPQYRAPSNMNNYAPLNQDEVMTVGSYVITMLLMCIPIVGFILTLVWAFGSNVNKNKKNYCRAALILMLVGIAVTIIASIILVTVFGVTVSSLDTINNFNF